MSWIRENLKQYIWVNEPVLKFLSKFSFIEIGAIALGPLMISRKEPSQGTINHERIHLFQYFELAFVFMWIVYLYDLFHGMIKYRKDFDSFQELGAFAYRRIRFEQEAYDKSSEPDYFATREWYAWRNYAV